MVGGVDAVVTLGKENRRVDELAIQARPDESPKT
jgi:hypothetical protein